MRTSRSLEPLQGLASTISGEVSFSLRVHDSYCSFVAEKRMGASRHGFTLLELMIVAGILALAIGVGLMSFRESSTSSTAVTRNLSMSMDLRQAADLLTETFIDSSEIISPVPGSSKSFVVMLDLSNFTRMLYLEAEPEKPGSQSGKTYALISYTDNYEGSYNAKRKRRLFGKIRKLQFTPITPGLVQAQLTLVSDAGKELGTLIELPLKNVSSVYD